MSKIIYATYYIRVIIYDRSVVDVVVIGCLFGFDIHTDLLTNPKSIKNLTRKFLFVPYLDNT